MTKDTNTPNLPCADSTVNRPPRVVVEIDRHGLLSITSDQPVSVVVLNHAVVEGDETTSIRGHTVTPQVQSRLNLVDAAYVDEVWKNVAATIVQEFNGSFEQVTKGSSAEHALRCMGIWPDR